MREASLYGWRMPRESRGARELLACGLWGSRETDKGRGEISRPIVAIQRPKSSLRGNGFVPVPPDLFPLCGSPFRFDTCSPEGREVPCTAHPLTPSLSKGDHDNHQRATVLRAFRRQDLLPSPPFVLLVS
jgi:hypothetical protein